MLLSHDVFTAQRAEHFSFSQHPAAFRRGTFAHRAHSQERLAPQIAMRKALSAFSLVIAGRPVVGVVGVARIGAPVAARLSAAGLSVIATDRRAETMENVVRDGARWPADVPELARAVDVVITVLPGPQELRGVIEPLLGDLRTAASGLT